MHALADQHDTALSGKSPVICWLAQRVPFQRRASGSVFGSQPTAVHALAAVQDTPASSLSSLSMALAAPGVGWTAHFLALQRSASGAVPGPSSSWPA